MNKIIIIGIDGGTFTIIDKMLSEDKLPNIAKMIKNGVRANLISTPYYWTSPAWPTMVTGMDAGGHGAFALTKLHGYNHRPISSLDIKSPRIWNYIGMCGGRSIVACIPMTFPPQPFRGSMITGMQTPNKRSNYTYPKTLKEEILKKFPDFVPEVFDTKPKFEMYLESIRNKSDVFKYLLQKPWNFFMCVFTETDKMQHKYWGSERIELLYEEIDKFIGYVIDLKHDVFVVSDHGSGLSDISVNINNWLNKHYFLVKNNEIRKLMSYKFQGGMPEINMSKTTAFGVEGGIRINLMEREPHGIVHPKQRNRLVTNIINLLKKEKLYDVVARREDVYHGKYIENCPDIVTIRKGGHHWDCNETEIVSPARDPGYHRRDGIFLYHTKHSLGINMKDVNIG